MNRRFTLGLLAGAITLLALPAVAQDKSIVVASTTSTEQSGLFGYILPIFKAKTGIDVRVVAQGTGQALDTGRRGDADVVFVHDKVAEAAGQSIVRFLQNLRSAAAELNPDFDVILRLEPFKVEHDYIKSGLGPHVTWEAPSLLVRGYALPYSHPKYADNPGVAGTIFHTTLDPQEAATLRQSRAQGVEPVLRTLIKAVQAERAKRRDEEVEQEEAVDVSPHWQP